jgi:hypothetical protein
VQEIAGGVRAELIGRIDREKSTALGPRVKARDEIIRIAMNDPALVRFIEEHAASAKRDLPAVQKQVRRYLEEIAADYSDFYVELWDKALTWLWNNIYDGVVFDREGLARVRDLSRRMPCVIIPCHRSHIDYLLLSYVFYKHNIPLPFIAAGTNLMFWPSGTSSARPAPSSSAAPSAETSLPEGMETTSGRCCGKATPSSSHRGGAQPDGQDGHAQVRDALHGDPGLHGAAPGRGPGSRLHRL